MDTGSPATHQEASLLLCQASRRIWSFPSQLDRRPDVAVQTGDLKGYPHSDWRIYLRLLLKHEVNYESFLTTQDEAGFSCIVCRTIPCSISNSEGSLTSLMEVQTVTKATVTI